MKILALSSALMTAHLGLVITAYVPCTLEEIEENPDLLVLRGIVNLANSDSSFAPKLSVDWCQQEETDYMRKAITKIEATSEKNAVK